MVLICKTLSLLHLRMLCAKFVKVVQWFWRWRFWNFVNIFLELQNNLPFKRAWPFIWTKLKDAVCKVWFYRRKCFNFFNVISPGKGVALHVNKLDTPLPRIHRANFGWNWPSGSEGEDENVKSLQAIRKALLSELKKTYIIFVGLEQFGVQWIMILSPSEKRCFK